MATPNNTVTSDSLVSIICCTENRPEFMPWLAHTFNALRVPDGYEKELVVIDSSEDKDASLGVLLDHLYDPGCSNLEWYHYPHPKCTIAAKSNIGMELAAGDLIGWLDDDDGKAPCWLEWAISTLGDKDILATRIRFPFVNLAMDLSGSCVRYVPTWMWSLGLYRTSAVEEIRFVEWDKHGRPNWRGQDTQWQGFVWQHTPIERQARETCEGLGFALSHDKNIANHKGKCAPYRWKYPLKRPAMWTEPEWAVTVAEIRKLKETIYPGQPGF